MKLCGIDFSSAPTRRKPIVVASGRLAVGRLELTGFELLESLDAFDDWLDRPGPWLGGFDFPFGLPRELLEAWQWLAGVGEAPAPGDPSGARAQGDTRAQRGAWAGSIRRVEALARPELVARLRTFCAGRPVGSKFAHRATDLPAGSSPSMKWVNPPVALMLHAGAPRLLRAGATLPGMHAGDPDRIALEAYPGFLARAIVGRESYKSDERRRQTPERREARARIVAALAEGVDRLGIAVRFPAGLASECVDDASGDRLDAVLCLAQAAWAWQRRDAGFGLPPGFDPIEGWIVSVPPGGAA